MSAELQTEPVAGARTSGLDGVAILTVYAVLLIGLPSRLVVGPLGVAGSPAALAALACALWWIWDALRRQDTVGKRLYPVRIAIGFFVASVAMSYVVAMRRPINMIEASTATVGLLTVAGWAGTLLLGHDASSDPRRIRALVRRLVDLGGLLALLGLVQFVSGEALIDKLAVPGLVSNTTALGVAERNGYNRPSGTAVHAIEFSVVVTMLLPLALVLAAHRDGRRPIRRWAPVVLMGAAVPVAISRSAIVGAVVGLIVVLPALAPRVRRLVIGGAALVGVGTFVLIPGLVGSMVRLFTGIEGDGSAQSRTNSYQIVWEYFQRNPLFGRGFSTFLPSHRILDNQYLGLLMDVGLVGLCAILALGLAGAAAGLSCRGVRSAAQIDRDLGQALAAAVVVGAVGFALFDGLSFPMAAGVFFLIIGLAGGLRRALREPADART